MTQKQEELKKYYIKMIHTLKSKVFVDEECRYEYMRAEFGKESLKDLSIDELRVMLEFVGYKPRYRKKGNITAPAAKRGNASQAQLNTIVGIWNAIARSKTERSLKLFCERIVGYIPLYLWYLQKGEAQKIITALTAMQKAKFDKQKA